MDIKSGGLIGFVSNDPKDYIADVINVATFGVPTYGVHHVGILGRLHDEPLLYESIGSADGRPPCCRSGQITSGCQAHPLRQILECAAGCQIWYYPLRRELYFHEEDRLLYYLDSKIGTPYDAVGAVRSGGLLFSAVNALLRDEDTSSFFCSEFCADALVHVGLLQTPNIGVWNPNRLLRHLVRKGVCARPRLLANNRAMPVIAC